MRGVLTDFKTHQRMDAADKLVSLSSDHTPCVPAPQPAARQPASDHDTVSAATPWKTPRKPEWKYFEYPEDHTYDFSSYGEEDYRRDRYGDKALVHIFGDDETKSAANQAVLDYKVDQIEAQRAAVHSEHDTCQPYDPCPSCRVPDPPRRRLLRPAHLRLQRPRLHIRRQGRGQGRLHGSNRPQREAEARPHRRRRCPSPRRPRPPRQRSRSPAQATQAQVNRILLTLPLHTGAVGAAVGAGYPGAALC